MSAQSDIQALLAQMRASARTAHRETLDADVPRLIDALERACAALAAMKECPACLGLDDSHEWEGMPCETCDGAGVVFVNPRPDDALAGVAACLRGEK